MAVVYPLAFVGMGVEGIWRASAGTWGTGLGFYAAGLLLFVVSKALKYWAITALQDRWTFKVLVLPAEPLVTTGPYRYVAHPNYVAVVGELAGTAMMMEAWYTGVAALAAFGLLLWQRISFETNALGEAYQKTKR